MHVGSWTCQCQWHRFGGCTFKCFQVMGYKYALSWKLLITQLFLECFATLLKIPYLKKIARKCSIFLHQSYFFLMGSSRTFLGGIRITVHLGRAKGRGKKTKMGVIFAKFPLLSKIQTFSHKLLVKLVITTTVISMPNNLNAETFK